MCDALLVLDCQVDYCLPEGQLGRLGRDFSPTRKLIADLNEFLPKARRMSIPVVLVRSETETLCRKGTRGAEFCIRVSPTDRVVTKHTYGAFYAPQLEQVLKELRVSRLVITGVDTHLCVESTVRQAWDLGWKVEVVQDLVATRGENAEMHSSSLQVMGKYFASLVSKAEVLRRWQTRFT